MACRSTDKSVSSLSIPIPLSLIFTSTPDLKTSILIIVALASKEFSIISLIIEAGFSTTSPAAMILDTLSSKILIIPKKISPFFIYNFKILQFNSSAHNYFIFFRKYSCQSFQIFFQAKNFYIWTRIHRKITFFAILIS